MKNKSRIIIFIFFLAVIISIGLFLKCNSDKNKSKEYKNISITIVYKDAEKKLLKIKTKEEYLGNEMKNQKLISDSQFKSGFYTEIDGEATNYEKDKSWWCIKRKGEMIMTGMNKQIIKDGDTFEFIYTK